jgi:hypothetical protein
MKLGVDEGAVLDVQTSTVTIVPLEVVVGDLHWSALEVHVQDVGIYVFGEAVLMMELPRRHSTPPGGGRFRHLCATLLGLRQRACCLRGSSLR